VKNYGVQPAAATGTARRALRDALAAGREVLRGDLPPTEWFATGRDVVTGVARGAVDGFVARLKDRSAARNPHGVSDRSDRAVARYDWR